MTDVSGNRRGCCEIFPEDTPQKRADSYHYGGQTLTYAGGQTLTLFIGESLTPFEVVKDGFKESFVYSKSTFFTTGFPPSNLMVTLKLAKSL